MSSGVKTLLVVCAGNICRSPMAEALFRHRLERHPRLSAISVASAGTIAIDGNRPCVDAVDLMRSRFDIDISAHRARSFTTQITADLILTMDRSTTEGVRAAAGPAPVEMLGDFVGTGEEVDDPYGGPMAGYRRALRALDRLVTGAMDRLDAEGPA